MSLDNFYSPSARENSYYSYCKDCNRKRSRIYYDKNFQTLREYSRDYSCKNKIKVTAFRKKHWEKWYENNKEKLKKAARKYYAQNKDRVKARERKYKRNNPEKIKILNQRRTQRLKFTKGKHSYKDWQAKLKYFGNCCYLCRQSLKGKDVHKEHRIPISRGGTNWASNIAPSCKHCNLQKGAMTEKEYRKKLTKPEKFQ